MTEVILTYEVVEETLMVRLVFYLMTFLFFSH